MISQGSVFLLIDWILLSELMLNPGYKAFAKLSSWNHCWHLLGTLFRFGQFLSNLEKDWQGKVSVLGTGLWQRILQKRFVFRNQTPEICLDEVETVQPLQV